jgi:hypothetical protein
MRVWVKAKDKYAESTRNTLSPSSKRVRSAFQFVYLAVFGNTIISLLGKAIAFDFGLEDSQLSATDNQLAYWVYIAFLVTISLHILRLYITMEFLEEEEAFFGSFYDGMRWYITLPEFVLRSLIIATVTLKLYSPESFGGIFGFLATLYGAMSAWSLWVWLVAGKPRDQVFLTSSLAGLIGCAAIWYILPSVLQDKSYVTLTLFMAVTLVFVGQSVVRHFYKYWGEYVNVYKTKLCVFGWNAGSTCNVADSGTAGSNIP